MRVPRPLLAALLLVLLAGLGPALASPSPVVAAAPELTLVADARYVVDPDAARVRVAVDILATNHKKDTATRRYFFDQAYLAVLPGTSGLRVSAEGAKPTVKVSKRTADYDLLLISFGTKVTSGRSLDLRLTFDLADAGGVVERDVRIGQALATFPVWAFGSEQTPGGTVEVVFPAGYHVEFAAGSIPGPTTVGDTIVYRSGRLQRPLEFFAYVVADREGAHALTPIETRVGDDPALVHVRAWKDDPAFAERVGDLFARGLPNLGEAIGLDYPRREPLTVVESVSRSLGGYAGLFDPTSGRISVDYAAGSLVVLHEAAHVWFNGSLLADRWANEGFASLYAARAAGALELPEAPGEPAPELEPARVPLNAWGPLGETDEGTEDYGYAASLELAEAIAARAGIDGLRDVWADAADRRSAYQPRETGAEPELVEAAPDWRGLLDLLESRSGRRFDDLWRSWVVRPGEAALLDERATTREQYEAVLDDAGDWELPRSIRAALTTWQFGRAAGLLAQADEVLAQRDDIETAAAAAGLTPPDTLESLFEGDRGLPAAHAEGRAERAALDALVAAAATRAADPEPLQVLGLLGSAPDLDLAAARSAFADGDLATAVEQADVARAVWTSAGDVGMRRAMSILGGVLLASLVVVLGIGGWRSRRAHRARPSAAAGAAVAEPRSVPGFAMIVTDVDSAAGGRSSADGDPSAGGSASP